MDILKRLTEFAAVERRFKNPIYFDAAEEISRLRAQLDRINMLACYASEEDVDAQPAVLLEIGKLARGEITRPDTPQAKT